MYLRRKHVGRGKEVESSQPSESYHESRNKQPVSTETKAIIGRPIKAKIMVLSREQLLARVLGVKAVQDLSAYDFVNRVNHLGANEQYKALKLIHTMLCDTPKVAA